MATDHTPMQLRLLRDWLVLALDQVETGPNDRAGLAHLVACLRPAMRLACAQHSRSLEASAE